MDIALAAIIALVVVSLLLLLVFQRSKRRVLPPEEDRPSVAPSQPLRRQVAPKEPGRPEQPSAPGRAAAAPERREEPAAPSVAKAPEQLPDVPAAAPLTAAEETLAGLPRAPEPTQPPPERDVDVLRRGLAHTRGGFIARLAKLFGNRPTIDASLLEQIEEVLITADIGVKTSERMLTRLREQMQNGELKGEDDVWKSLREMAVSVLNVPHTPTPLDRKPSLILIVGVNGAGKTTTIGKLAARFSAAGRKVLLAAGDTYRAAAVLQLEVWGRRVNCPVIKGKEGGDPSAVIFEAIKRAQEEGYDLVIADTAGRLHTKAPLMEELKKVDRTIQKALAGRPADEIFLVLDATTGQNAVQQVHMFREALQVSGVVLTKLDGTAKGGMVLGIVDEHRVPVRFIGLGERVEDLREFDAVNFVEALFSKPDGETLAA
jgi:fused signal recognition particle receptor